MNPKVIDLIVASHTSPLKGKIKELEFAVENLQREIEAKDERIAHLESDRTKLQRELTKKLIRDV